MSFVTTNTAFSNTIAHFPSYTASRQGHRDHVHIEHVLVLRPYHSVLVQWFSSRRSDSSWRMTRVGSAGVEMRHIYIRPFLYLLFSLCPATPFPLSRSFSVHPSSSFSASLRGVPTEAPPRGCVVTAESSNVDRIPNWVGGVSAKGRLAQVEVRGKYRSLHAAYLSSRAPSFPVYSDNGDNGATLPLVNGDEGGPFAKRGSPGVFRRSAEEKVLNGNSDRWSEKLFRCRRKIGDCVLEE